jgi:hypothetical protein
VRSYTEVAKNFSFVCALAMKHTRNSKIVVIDFFLSVPGLFLRLVFRNLRTTLMNHLFSYLLLLWKRKFRHHCRIFAFRLCSEAASSSWCLNDLFLNIRFNTVLHMHQVYN